MEDTLKINVFDEVKVEDEMVSISVFEPEEYVEMAIPSPFYEFTPFNPSLYWTPCMARAPSSFGALSVIGRQFA